jgi:4,5-DOPA dioxygenase extradiol
MELKTLILVSRLDANGQPIFQRLQQYWWYPLTGLAKGTQITAMDFPKTIHDFGGFPQALFDVQYNAPGHPALAKETASMITSTQIELDHEWGLDHGTWTVVRHMYPEANIPVLQLSIDYTKGSTMAL